MTEALYEAFVSIGWWEILVTMCNTLITFLIIKKFLYKPVRKMRVGQDAIAIKRHITKSETQPEVQADDGVTAKKIQNVYVYCQYITRIS